MTDTALPRTPERPGTAYRVLERRVTAGTVGVLLCLSAVAWWSTVENAREMRDMVQGLAQVGDAMPYDMGAAVFLGMWLTMMVAMMLLTVGPIVLLHRMVVRRYGGGMAPTVVFAGGYLAVWAVLGIVPLALLLAFRDAAEGTAWAARSAGGVLAVAGAYQFTRWKDACARACRSPLTFLVTHDFGAGLRGGFRAGVVHGLYCLGCCWALMAVLFAVGLMNLVWMAAIAAVFLAEKHWHRGRELARVVGTALLALGILVLLQPDALRAVTQEPAPADMPMDRPVTTPGDLPMG